MAKSYVIWDGTTAIGPYPSYELAKDAGEALWDEGMCPPISEWHGSGELMSENEWINDATGAGQRNWRVCPDCNFRSWRGNTWEPGDLCENCHTLYNDSPCPKCGISHSPSPTRRLMEKDMEIARLRKLLEDK